MVCEEVLEDQGYADVGGDSDVKGRISYPKSSETFFGYSLSHSVENVFIGEFTIWAFLHFLELGFGVVERQAHEG